MKTHLAACLVLVAFCGAAFVAGYRVGYTVGRDQCSREELRHILQERILRSADTNFINGLRAWAHKQGIELE